MNLIKRITLASLAIGLVLQVPTVQAANSTHLRLTFEKSFAGGGPAGYLFHFNGSYEGGLTGMLFTGVRDIHPIDQNGGIIYLEADYVFFDSAGNHLFTASVQGKQNNHTRKAVLNGEVTCGALEGAQVHVEFDDVGGGAYRGTIKITGGAH